MEKVELKFQKEEFKEMIRKKSEEINNIGIAFRQTVESIKAMSEEYRALTRSLKSKPINPDEIKMPTDAQLRFVEKIWQGNHGPLQLGTYDEAYGNFPGDSKGNTGKGVEYSFPEDNDTSRETSQEEEDGGYWVDM